MYLPYITILLCILTASLANPVDPNPLDARRSLQIVPFVPSGPIAALQDPTGRSLIFQQKSDSSIWQWGTTGPFNSGVSNSSQNLQVVPAAEALLGTPIATTGIDETFASSNASFRIYFFSKTNVVSEYIWTNDGSGWKGGSTCTECLTQAGFTATASSKLLYAMKIQNGSRLRVGFSSAGLPGTLAEADSSGAGDWVLAGLPAVQ